MDIRRAGQTKTACLSGNQHVYTTRTIGYSPTNIGCGECRSKPADAIPLAPSYTDERESETCAVSSLGEGTPSELTPSSKTREPLSEAGESGAGRRAGMVVDGEGEIGAAGFYRSGAEARVVHSRVGDALERGRREASRLDCLVVAAIRGPDIHLGVVVISRQCDCPGSMRTDHRRLCFCRNTHCCRRPAFLSSDLHRVAHRTAW
jgi:hypothetical protein